MGELTGRRKATTERLARTTVFIPESIRDRAQAVADRTGFVLGAVLRAAVEAGLAAVEADNPEGGAR